MGLFDFIKSAGRILGGPAGVVATAQEAAVARSEQEQQHPAPTAEAIQQEIWRLGLPANQMTITVSGDTVQLKGWVNDMATKERIVLAVGNVAGVGRIDEDIETGKVPSSTPPETQSVFYTVKKGDTLSGIAKQHYGEPNKYRVVFEANKPMLTDPDKIYPGQVLRIPQ